MLSGSLSHFPASGAATQEFLKGDPLELPMSRASHGTYRAAWGSGLSPLTLEMLSHHLPTILPLSPQGETVM